MSSPLGENATLRPVAAKKPKEKVESVEAEEDDDSKIFPQKLMEILADEKNHESICWLPHGRAFTIRDRKLFAETVMPRCFSRKAKYSSFTRKLNRWYVTLGWAGRAMLVLISHLLFSTGTFLVFHVDLRPVLTIINSFLGTNHIMRLKCFARTPAPNWPWLAPLRWILKGRSNLL